MSLRDQPFSRKRSVCWVFNFLTKKLTPQAQEVNHLVRISQFQENQVTSFKPFSKYPPCYKDVSFWLPPAFHENDLYEQIRNVGGDIVEDVRLIDEFQHPKTKKESQAYRITYRHMSRTLTDAEVDSMQLQVRENTRVELGCEVR